LSEKENIKLPVSETHVRGIQALMDLAREIAVAIDKEIYGAEESDEEKIIALTKLIFNHLSQWVLKRSKRKRVVRALIARLQNMDNAEYIEK